MSGHAHDLTPFIHDHPFAAPGADTRARSLRQVTWVTLVAMAVELIAGYWSASLALTADGWHMGTHAVALGGAALAMHLSQRAAHSRRFAFGGWKIEMLAAYSSALLMMAVSLSLVWQAAQALRDVRPVAYVEAMLVAALGLAVNLVCAWLLARSAHAGSADRQPGDGRTHAHAQANGHDHGGGHGHHADNNFRAAWLHVMGDALTSVLALLALAGGLWFGARWLDPAVALVGALVIARWGWGVIGAAARALVDVSADDDLTSAVRQRIESDGDARLADLHVWQVGPLAYSAAMSIVADRPLTSDSYRRRLHDLPQLRHVTLEVQRCHQGVDAHVR